MKNALLFGILALTVGCAQTVPTAHNDKAAKTTLPLTVNCRLALEVPADQIEEGSAYQTMQRGGRGGAIGGRSLGSGRFSRMGGGRFFRDREGGFRFRNRFFGFNNLYYPLYDYGGQYYPDYYEPYTYTAGAYTPYYNRPLYNWPSYASGYGLGYAPCCGQIPPTTAFAAPGCCGPVSSGMALGY